MGISPWDCDGHSTLPWFRRLPAQCTRRPAFGAPLLLATIACRGGKHPPGSHIPLCSSTTAYADGIRCVPRIFVMVKQQHHRILPGHSSAPSVTTWRRICNGLWLCLKTIYVNFLCSDHLRGTCKLQFCVYLRLPVLCTTHNSPWIRCMTRLPLRQTHHVCVPYQVMHPTSMATSPPAHLLFHGRGSKPWDCDGTVMGIVGISPWDCDGHSTLPWFRRHPVQCTCSPAFGAPLLRAASACRGGANTPLAVTSPFLVIPPYQNRCTTLAHLHETATT